MLPARRRQDARAPAMLGFFNKLLVCGTSKTGEQEDEGPRRESSLAARLVACSPLAPTLVEKGTTAKVALPSEVELSGANSPRTAPFVSHADWTRRDPFVSHDPEIQAAAMHTRVGGQCPPEVPSEESVVTSPAAATAVEMSTTAAGRFVSHVGWTSRPTFISYASKSASAASAVANALTAASEVSPPRLTKPFVSHVDWPSGTPPFVSHAPQIAAGA